MAKITPAQIRAARALLGWTQVELSQAAGIATVTVKKLESWKIDARTSTMEAIEQAFAEAGVAFVAADESGGDGVRFRRPVPSADA